MATEEILKLRTKNMMIRDRKKFLETQHKWIKKTVKAKTSASILQRMRSPQKKAKLVLNA